MEKEHYSYDFKNCMSPKEYHEKKQLLKLQRKYLLKVRICHSKRLVISIIEKTVDELEKRRGTK